MIETTIDAPDGALKAIQDVLRDLLEKDVVDALLVPMTMPAGNGSGEHGRTVAPMLVTDPAALAQANPLAPVLPINAARAVANLTATEHRERLAVVLRPCEIRALVELTKFQQANLDDVLIVGVDCLGTYRVADYQQLGPAAADDLLAGAAAGDPQSHEGFQFRAACQMCEQPIPAGDHVALTVGLVGVTPGQVYLKARDDLAQTLDLSAGDMPPGRAAAIEKLVTARTQARDAVWAEFRGRVNSMDALLAEFATCIRCHNCMINCPICYCKECIFRTATFDHESQLYYQWAERKGAVRLLSDTLLFHLTRLNHMVTSCVGCGMCTEACPADIPVGTVFRSVGEKVQALFDYHPGRSLDEAAPVQEFREDELTALGERPHS
ncbi:MAG: 4Fe-4S dicluster domain-containing protein [Chloroflexi bacterium]|nr:4Fe-4S dicluster domain-containing protein [Chloroflexota bacterium]MBU1749319.1 4Fe-4S dicluster domain-containing protein [Chloroflexota bacterium]